MALRHYVSDMASHKTSLDNERYPWYVFRGHPVAKMPPKDRIHTTESWFVDPEQSPTPPSLYGAFEAASAFDAHPHKPSQGHAPLKYEDRWASHEQNPGGPLRPRLALREPPVGAGRARERRAAALPQHGLERVRLWCEKWLVYPRLMR